MFLSTPFASPSARTKTTAAPGTPARWPRRRWFAYLVISAGLAAFTTGCQGPCDSLAEKICSCEINANEEQSCLLRMQIVGDRIVTTEEAERCDTLMDNCTCEALEREDFAACGLSNTP